MPKMFNFIKNFLYRPPHTPLILDFLETNRRFSWCYAYYRLGWVKLRLDFSRKVRMGLGGLKPPAQAKKNILHLFLIKKGGRGRLWVLSSKTRDYPNTIFIILLHGSFLALRIIISILLSDGTIILCKNSTFLKWTHGLAINHTVAALQ